MSTPSRLRVMSDWVAARVRDWIEREPAGPAPMLVTGLAAPLHYVARPPAARTMPLSAPSGHDRTDVVAAWAASGVLTWGEAELLMALDETTAWGPPQHR